MILHASPAASFLLKNEYKSYYKQHEYSLTVLLLYYYYYKTILRQAKVITKDCIISRYLLIARNIYIKAPLKKKNKKLYDVECQRKHVCSLALDAQAVVMDQVSSSQVSCWLLTLTKSNSPGFTRSNFSCLKVRRDGRGDLKLLRRNTETQVILSKHFVCPEDFTHFCLWNAGLLNYNGLTLWIKRFVVKTMELSWDQEAVCQ